MKRDETYIRHALDAIERIEEFLAGMTYVKFVQDPKTAFAVIKMMEIIGEAVNRLSPAFQEAHPEIPFAKIVSMRNHLIHQYAEIDLETVWKVYEENLGALKISLLKSLE